MTRWIDGSGRNYFKRFWSKVDPSGDCWEWTGTIDDKGYGLFKVNGNNVYAHRDAYTQLVCDVDGLVLDHLCRNTLCVNPDHLEPVSQQTNVLRGYGPAAKNARKTHCKRGHAFTDENTINHPKGRNCRACEVMRRKAKTPPPHSTDEGSVTYYRQGCRCDGCRRVATAARKRLRQESAVPVGGEG